MLSFITSNLSYVTIVTNRIEMKILGEVANDSANGSKNKKLQKIDVQSFTASF